MLYTGIDIGKTSHVASFLSPALLSQYHKYEQCPTLAFDQSRAGFEKLFSVMTTYAPVEQCHVLLETTGHYGRALEQYLQEKGVQVYQVHVQQREPGRQKSDKRDAQALAVLLYNQIERRILVADKRQIARRLVMPSETARLLRGLVQHRYELVHETVRRKNKLTAIADELFPELTQVYRDPNGASALQLRETFPTPREIVEARLEDLIATRKRNRPSDAQFAEIQALARVTIGTKDPSRVQSLTLEQQQLITELRLLHTHIERLNSEIEQAVSTSREGQILTSLGVIGPVQAACILSHIGSIANFESAAKLRGYCGWSPLETQTGTSIDTVSLEREGNRLLKHTLYLITLQAIRMDTPWKALYNRLVPIKCTYDERLKRYRGRMKVIGRIAGQIVQVVYVLLKRDYDLLQRTPVGAASPPPELYDVKKHRIKRHRPTS